MKNELHLIESIATVRDALRALNALPGGLMTLFVADEGRVIGTLTDGDIRRALIAGASLDTPAANIAFRRFLALRPQDSRFELFAEARSKGIRLLPCLDAEGRLTEIIDLSLTRAALPIEAVLMAGGKGERLRPLTNNCPKPLLKVGEKAIIDYNVEELLRCGTRRVFVTVNYLKEQIIEHFASEDMREKIVCVEEPRRMGTIGSLSLIAEQLEEETLLLMNSDLLTSLDFEALYRHHLDSGADLTMGAVPYTVSVPFSILKTEGEKVVGVTEKPTFNYFAGAGVYMMRTGLARKIPKGEYLDAPDFVASLIEEGRRVSFFPIEGTWIDIGSPDDYRYANEILSNRLVNR